MIDQRASSSGHPASSALDPSSATTGSGRIPKLCCVCGEDLVGRQRFKDSSGKYWCPTCVREEKIRNEPATCPDCGRQLTRGELVAIEQVRVCQVCADKRRMAAKRAAARLRAVEEEVKRDRARRQATLVVAATVLGVLFVFGLALLWIWLS